MTTITAPQKPVPKGWTRISSALFYAEAGKAIDFLCDAFGFEVRLKVEGEGGRIEHSELEYGEGMIMVGEAGGKSSREGGLPTTSPKMLGGKSTQSLCVFVDDVDAHCAHARKAGAVILDEPFTNDYGPDYWTDRSYRAADPEGHQWFFMQRLRGPSENAK